jgi:phospholipid/cholesterol/gamma-HCH transport system permease protein
MGLVFATAAGLVVALTHNGTTAGYLASFDAGFTTVDIIANLVKTMGFGFLIAAICAYGGMNAKGGSEGVGRAVNDSVVQAFAAVWIFNFAFNALYLALFPSALAVR